MPGLQKEVFTFSVVNSCPGEVVKVLCWYLEQEGCSKISPTRAVELPFKWQATVTVSVDFIPLKIELGVEEEGDEIVVTLNDLTLNDVIRCRRMFNSLLRFVQEQGLDSSCTHQLAHCFRLLDDDFDTPDYDIDELDAVLLNIHACKYNLNEESLETLACLAKSSVESPQGLESASISSLLHMESLLETYPCWLRHCETW